MQQWTSTTCKAVTAAVLERHSAAHVGLNGEGFAARADFNKWYGRNMLGPGVSCKPAWSNGGILAADSTEAMVDRRKLIHLLTAKHGFQDNVVPAEKVAPLQLLSARFRYELQVICMASIGGGRKGERSEKGGIPVDHDKVLRQILRHWGLLFWGFLAGRVMHRRDQLAKYDFPVIVLGDPWDVPEGQKWAGSAAAKESEESYQLRHVIKRLLPIQRSLAGCRAPEQRVSTLQDALAKLIQFFDGQDGEGTPEAERETPPLWLCTVYVAFILLHSLSDANLSAALAAWNADVPKVDFPDGDYKKSRLKGKAIGHGGVLCMMAFFWPEDASSSAVTRKDQLGLRVQRRKQEWIKERDDLIHAATDRTVDTCRRLVLLYVCDLLHLARCRGKNQIDSLGIDSAITWVLPTLYDPKKDAELQNSIRVNGTVRRVRPPGATGTVKKKEQIDGKGVKRPTAIGENLTPPWLVDIHLHPLLYLTAAFLFSPTPIVGIDKTPDDAERIDLALRELHYYRALFVGTNWKRGASAAEDQQTSKKRKANDGKAIGVSRSNSPSAVSLELMELIGQPRLVAAMHFAGVLEGNHVPEFRGGDVSAKGLRGGYFLRACLSNLCICHDLDPADRCCLMWPSMPSEAGNWAMAMAVEFPMLSQRIPSFALVAGTGKRNEKDEGQMLRLRQNRDGAEAAAASNEREEKKVQPVAEELTDVESMIIAIHESGRADEPEEGSDLAECLARARQKQKKLAEAQKSERAEERREKKKGQWKADRERPVRMADEARKEFTLVPIGLKDMNIPIFFDVFPPDACSPRDELEANLEQILRLNEQADQFAIDEINALLRILRPPGNRSLDLTWQLQIQALARESGSVFAGSALKAVEEAKLDPGRLLVWVEEVASKHVSSRSCRLKHGLAHIRRNRQHGGQELDPLITAFDLLNLGASLTDIPRMVMLLRGTRYEDYSAAHYNMLLMESGSRMHRCTHSLSGTKIEKKDSEKRSLDLRRWPEEKTTHSEIVKFLLGVWKVQPETPNALLVLMRQKGRTAEWPFQRSTDVLNSWSTLLVHEDPAKSEEAIAWFDDELKAIEEPLLKSKHGSTSLSALSSLLFTWARWAHIHWVMHAKDSGYFF